MATWWVENEILKLNGVILKYISTHGFVVKQCGHVPLRFPEELGYQRFAACHVAGTDGAEPFFPPGKAKAKNVRPAPHPSGEA